MPPLEAFLYPLLLAATVAIHRVGRGERRARLFEWARLAVLAAILALVVTLQMRFAESGILPSPLAIFGGALSIAALTGLVGLHVLALVEGLRARRRAPGLVS